MAKFRITNGYHRVRCNSQEIQDLGFSPSVPSAISMAKELGMKGLIKVEMVVNAGSKVIKMSYRQEPSGVVVEIPAVNFQKSWDDAILR